MTILANTLPNSNDGYVAAAYIVFFAVVLIYVAIMAVRLGRVERRLGELGREAQDSEAEEDPSESGLLRARTHARADSHSETHDPGSPQPAATAHAPRDQEREAV